MDTEYQDQSSQPGTSRGPRLFFWRILVFSALALVLLYQLGGRALNEPDEARFAEVGREMAASGDYLTPRLNGAMHLAKPPLTYWLMAGSIRLFGENEWAVRLPNFFAAMLVVVAVYLLIRRLSGEEGALWAVAILGSSGLFLGMSRLITTDMLLTGWVTLSVWFLWRWYDADRRTWRRALPFFVSLALAMLTKGPVGVVLPLFALLGLGWRNPGFRWRELHWFKGILLFFAIAAPWFVAVAWNRPGIWDYFLGREVVGRVFTGVHNRGKDWWFFLPVLAVGMLPWTPLLLLLPSVFKRTDSRRKAAIRMFLGWAGLGFLLFTISRSKLITYVLPLIPPLAVLAALSVLSMFRKDARMERMATGVLVLFWIGLMASPAAAAWIVWRKFEIPASQSAQVWIAGGAGALVALVFLFRRNIRLSLGAAAVSVWIMFLAGNSIIPSVETRLHNHTSARFLSEILRSQNPDGSRQVISYRDFMPGLAFYLGKPVLWLRPDVDPADPAAPKVFEFRSAGSPYILDGEEISRKQLATQARLLVVVRRPDIRTLEQQFPGKFRALDRIGPWVVLGN